MRNNRKRGGGKDKKVRFSDETRFSSAGCAQLIGGEKDPKEGGKGCLEMKEENSGSALVRGVRAEGRRSSCSAERGG